jgi:hypothetical protein
LANAAVIVVSSLQIKERDISRCNSFDWKR